MKPLFEREEESLFLPEHLPGGATGLCWGSESGKVWLGHVPGNPLISGPALSFRQASLSRSTGLCFHGAWGGPPTACRQLPK